jgi:hypothetical protein
MSNWLEFISIGIPANRKMAVYNVRNQVANSHIGVIYWYGGFRKYVFEPAGETIFDANCLQEVSTFLKGLMEEWKKNKFRGKRVDTKEWIEGSGNIHDNPDLIKQ